MICMQFHAEIIHNNSSAQKDVRIEEHKHRQADGQVIISVFLPRKIKQFWLLTLQKICFYSQFNIAICDAP